MIKIKLIKQKGETLLGKEFFGFLNHSKNYISAGVFSKGISIITVPIFTRLLIPEDYGILAILTSFISIFGIVYGLGLRGAVVRYFYEEKKDFPKYLGSNIGMLLIWSLLLSSILFLAIDQLIVFFNVPKNILYIGIFIVAFKVFFNLYESYLQASKRSKLIARLNIIQRILSVAIAIPLILVLKENKFYGKAFAMLAMAAFFGAYSLYKLWKLLEINFNAKYLKYSLMFSLPVVFHYLSAYVLSSFDQVIINQLVGKAETGLYSLAYSIGAIQNMISHGMLRAWSPEFYANLNRKNYTSINRLASKFAKMVYLSAFSIILFAKELVIVLSDKKYHEALSIVPIIVISYVLFFLYTMYVNFAFYKKKTQLIALFTIIAGLINIGLNYWLIPVYGYKVAAWTTLASYACLFILHYTNVKFIIKPEWITSLKVLLPNFGVFILMVLLFTFFSQYINNLIILILFKICLFVALLYLFFRKNINTTLFNIRNEK